eukprot:CAMPEP_0113845156 /NCGR_PEP_ID=MMETSP0372-20130328/605_1 /TAXON_ID=340204 /ORGANISM="Lankesteria abbotti" /LENGTH=415 /DNA_ID=CAMNT_0000814177 /DNA_START=168 /DNA_END=1415 /DNA_ORIENTATION=- /assembly_acc=CAM_ASM_000359
MGEKVENHHLSFYYDRIFPFNSLSKWLCYRTLSSDPNFFSKREFAIVMARGEDDIYSRWNCFRTTQAWRQAILRQDIPPHKMDIGAVYSIPITDKDTLSHSFRPVERELVFDIDMDDYDDIRTCCKEKKVCKKCWKFLALAMKLLTVALRDDFGFKHTLWVFSGRRGVHCWVADRAARQLPSEGRTAIVDYLNLVTGSAQQKKKVQVFSRGGKCHPMIKRAFLTASSCFSDIVEEQQIFDRGSSHVEKVISYLQPKQAETFRAVLAAEWKSGASVDFWELLCKTVPSTDSALMEIVLSYSYPRLDVNVSKDIGHLLKSPFCVHLATGRICVPISSDDVDAFDPLDVPTLTALVKEYKTAMDAGDSGGGVTTALDKYVSYFEQHFVKPLLDSEENVPDVKCGTVNVTSEENAQLNW